MKLLNAHRSGRLLVMLFMAVMPALPSAAQAETTKGHFWGGISTLSGDVTYQIGGRFSSPGGSFNYWFPISELVWPLNVNVAVAGGLIDLNEQWQLGGEFSKNLTTYAGKMKDSDWTDPLHIRTKTIYSESTANLQALTADVDLRYWLARTRSEGITLGLAAGGGWFYEQLDWDARDLDQWYPQNPELGHDIVSGLIGTYGITTNMPYLEIAGGIYGDGSSLLLRVGYSPFAVVEDADDHILRSISETARLQGDAFRISLQGNYDFASNWFINAKGDMLSFDMKGRDNNLVYAGPDRGETWSIEHRITSMQYTLSLGIGVRF